MKIISNDQKIKPRIRLSWVKKFCRHWFFQTLLFISVFIAGMLVYRAGILRPIYAGVHSIFMNGFVSADLPDPVNELVESVVNETRMYVNNGLPTLYIDLPFTSLEKLRAKRDEALQKGILVSSDEDFVSAQVQLQDGQKLDAKLRLKGDWTDHLQGEKWSYRIEIKDDGEIFHAQNFSIQSPETRAYLSEWAFHQNMIQEGILTTRYNFVNVLQNGNLLGIYALEESFAPALMESQGRRQGVIIRFDEDLMWENMGNFWSSGVHIEGEFMTTNQWSSDITPFKPSRIAKDPILAEEAETAIGLLRSYQLGQRKASEVFDLQLMGKFFALSDLWSACHGTFWHNMRFYYNPLTGLLEPVAFDNEPFTWCDQQHSIVGEFIKESLFDDPEIRTAYASELALIADPSYVDQLKEDFIAQHDELLSSLRVEYPTQEIGVPWDKLEDRAISLQQELSPSIPVRAAYYFSDHQLDSAETETSVLNLELINLMVLPVEILRVEVDGVSYFIDDVSLPMVQNPYEKKFIPMQISIPIDTTKMSNGDDISVSIIASLTGLDQEIMVEAEGGKMPEAVQVGPVPVQPTLQEVLNQHKFLEIRSIDNSLVVSPGNWHVDGDLILPDGMELYLLAGTTLQFEPGAILYTSEALNLKGTPSQPIVLTAQDAVLGWGGIVVLRASEDSLWENAYVERMSGISRDGWILTGGITFFQSNIHLDSTYIGNNRTEDAINVIHGNFLFESSVFANTFADAFDGDFSHGEVVNCKFHDIAGDAVDLSGSQVFVTGTQIQNVVDKGISVGEESTVTVKNTVIDVVGIGVASKDLSKTYISDSEISNASFAALAAYIKKPVFGPALIEATNVVIINAASEAIAQNQNEILLNGKKVKTIEMDVELLYDQKLLGN